MANCTSCGREIEWSKNTATGKMIPLDPHPKPDGNIVKLATSDPGGATMIRTVRKDNPAPPGADLYVSHFSTCPNAANHRRR
jgi:hypothetical protein